MCIGGYGHRRIGTSAPVRGGVQNEAPVLKDRENGIDHRGVPSSLSRGCYTPSLSTHDDVAVYA